MRDWEQRVDSLATAERQGSAESGAPLFGSLNRQHIFAATGQGLQSVWEIATASDQSLKRCSKVGVITKTDEIASAFVDAVIGTGGVPARTRFLQAAFYEIMMYPGEWSVVVVHLDDFGHISVLFDLVRSFRLRCPGVPVVLASRKFSKDDLTLERLPLCDASLSVPSTIQSIRAALDAAIENNDVWHERNYSFRGGIL